MDEQVSPRRRMGGKINLIWVGCGFGVFYWVLESVRDVLAFGRGTLTQRLFYPDLASVWMRLMIIALIIFYGFYAQSLRTTLEEDGKGKPWGQAKVIISGLMFAILYWILETARDVYIFQKGELLERLLTPDIASLSVRLLAMSVLILFSIYVQNLINDRRIAEAAMLKNREELEKKVEEKTNEIRKVNETLRQEMEGRKRLENALWVSRRSFHDIADAVRDGIVILDANQKVKFANLAFQSFLGRNRDTIVGEVFTLPVHPGEARQVTLDGAKGATEVQLRVVETEWQDSRALLVVLHPAKQADLLAR